MDKMKDDGFVAELEIAAKRLSICTDQTATAELRRLFGELQSDGKDVIEAILSQPRERHS